MTRISRNAPCPCGSGRKHKLCCGETRAQARMRADAAATVALIPALFPVVRPSSPAFEAWADNRCACTVTTEELNEGLDLLSDAERSDLVSRGQALAPLLWQLAGPGEGTEAALLAGAVLAALGERCHVDGLDLLEDGRHQGETDAEVLALGLDAPDLWSIREATEVDEALSVLDDELDDERFERGWNSIVAREAARLSTDEHREHLARMVARLEARLPLAELPIASAELAKACAAFARDQAVRDELIALLLADAACLAPAPAAAVAA